MLTHLKNILTIFNSTDDWTKTNLELVMRNYCQQHHIYLRDISLVIRACTTGKLTGVGIFDVLDILGKTAVTNRIKRVISLKEKS